MMSGRLVAPPAARRAGARFVAVVAVVALAAGALTGCGGESWEKACVTSVEGVIECTPEQRREARAVTGELLEGGTYDVA